MYRSALVPRRLAILGLVGGAVHIVGFLGVLFGAFDAGSAPQFLFTAPEIAWEATLPIYVLWKGFKSATILSLDDRAPAVEPSMVTV